MERSQYAENGWIVEHVSGPYWGYFIAGYVARCADGYHAYLRICESRPENVWEIQNAVSKLTTYCADSYFIALALAEARAVERIRHWITGVHVDVVLDGHLKHGQSA